MRLGRGGMASCCYKRSCAAGKCPHARARGSKPPTHADVPEGCENYVFLDSSYSSMKFSINKSVTARWSRQLWQVIAEALTELAVQLRGPSKTVGLDESRFCRSKYNRGKRYPQQWVFGGTYRETGDASVVPVENRSSQTLLLVVQ
ncbi:hypothetical protein M514_23765, partial [Trichuris suis]